MNEIELPINCRMLGTSQNHIPFFVFVRKQPIKNASQLYILILFARSAGMSIRDLHLTSSTSSI